jgi:hypothetical protein
LSKIEEYSHPRWQAMRLKAMQNDRFSCAACGSTETTLHVHHKRHKRVEAMVSSVRELAPFMLQWSALVDRTDGLIEDCPLEVMIQAEKFFSSGSAKKEFETYEAIEFKEKCFSILQDAADKLRALMGMEPYV